MKKNLLLSLVLFNSFISFSQVNEDMIMDRFNMNAFNPAYVGIDGKEISFSSRSKWQGIGGAPSTNYIFYSGARKKNLSIGASVISNKVFIDTRTQYALDASYQLQMGDDKNLYLGTKIGATTTNSDINDLNRITSEVNPFISNSNNSIFPVFGVGALYKTKYYYLSASIPNILNPENFVDEDSSISSEKPITYLMAGTSFYSNIFNADIKPFISTKLNPNTDTVTHFGSTIDFNNTLEIGGGYKTNGFSNVMLIYKTKFGLSLAYAYDFGAVNVPSSINRSGSEIFLKYNFGKNPTPKKDPKSDSK
jgi:type IX secretion system PorP/SprF family membrane protein